MEELNQIKLFYSWQSDNVEQKKLIRKALTRSKTNLTKKGIKLEIDSDARDEPGSPYIPHSIFHKIKESQIFLADVTLVFKGINRKSVLSPNPNVLVELGYAISELGWNRIIPVLNVNNHTPEDLPFDIRQHATLRYKDKDELSEKITHAILTIFQKSIRISKQSKYQSYLNENLAHGRLQRALKIFAEFPELKFNFSEGLKITLKNNENPLEYLKRCIEITEIRPEGSYTYDEYIKSILYSNRLGEIIIMTIFFKDPDLINVDFYDTLYESCDSAMDFFGSIRGSDDITSILLYLILNCFTKNYDVKNMHLSDYETRLVLNENIKKAIDLLKSNKHTPEVSKQFIHNYTFQ